MKITRLFAFFLKMPLYLKFDNKFVHSLLNIYFLNHQQPSNQHLQELNTTPASKEKTCTRNDDMVTH